MKWRRRVGGRGRGRKERKKRGRGQNEYSGVVCLCGGGQRTVDSACALDHHHSCLSLCVPPKFSLSQNVCASCYPYNSVLFFSEASSSPPCSYWVYSAALAPGTTASIRVVVQFTRRRLCQSFSQTAAVTPSLHSYMTTADGECPNPEGYH
jgi:hypothetical protein